MGAIIRIAGAARLLLHSPWPYGQKFGLNDNVANPSGDPSEEDEWISGLFRSPGRFPTDCCLMSPYTRLWRLWIFRTNLDIACAQEVTLADLMQFFQCTLMMCGTVMVTTRHKQKWRDMADRMCAAVKDGLVGI